MSRECGCTSKKVIFILTCGVLSSMLGWFYTQPGKYINLSKMKTSDYLREDGLKDVGFVITTHQKLTRKSQLNKKKRQKSKLESTIIQTGRKEKPSREQDGGVQKATKNQDGGVQKATKNQDGGVQKATKNQDGGVQKATGNQAETTLVLFTTWEDNEEKKLIHQNVENNWLLWKPVIQPLFFYSNTITGNKMKQAGWTTLPISGKACKASQIPTIKHMFLDSMNNYKSLLYGYANGDILFDNRMLKAIDFISKTDIVRQKPIMVLVRRTNVDFSNGQVLDKSSNFDEIAATGKPLTDGSSDGFFTNALFPWQYVPDIVIGRIGIGMWIVAYARAMNVTIINISRSVHAIHMTTKSGNYESHWKPNSRCNHDIYKETESAPSSWGCGFIQCANLDVSISKEGIVSMRPTNWRKMHLKCFNCTMNLTNLLPRSYGQSAKTKFPIKNKF